MKQWVACVKDEKCKSSMEFCAKNTNSKDAFIHCADQEPLLKKAIGCVQDNCCSGIEM